MFRARHSTQSVGHLPGAAHLGAASVAVLLASSGCASTTVAGSWTANDYARAHLQRILVVAATKNEPARSLFENTIASELGARGFEPELGSNVLPPDAAKMDRTVLRALIEERGLTAVMVVALADVSTRTTYRPPSYDPWPYYGSFHSYYQHHWALPPPMPPIYGTPGTVKEEQVIALEAMVYDLLSEQGNGMVWNARTSSVDPASLSTLADDYARVIVKEFLAAKPRR